MKMRHRPQFTIGRLMVLVALVALQVTLLVASIEATGTDRIFALIAAAWLLPCAILFLLARPADRGSVAGWAARLVLARTCPRCARRAMLAQDPDRLIFACGMCGGRFLREGDRFRSLPAPEDHRGEWMAPYLRSLREVRRRMRPDPALGEPKICAAIGPASRPESEAPAAGPDLGPRPAPRPRSMRGGLAATSAVFASIAPTVALVVASHRLLGRNADALFLVLTVVLYTLFFCLMIGFLGSFRWPKILLMLAVTAGAQAIILAASARDPGLIQVLAASITIPAIPMGLASLLARFEPAGPEPSDSTCSALLRSKRRRLATFPLAAIARKCLDGWDRDIEG